MVVISYFTLMKERILFIINPFSGTSDKKTFERIALSQLPVNSYEATFQYTTHAGHGRALATDAVKNGYTIVVAVGGDGSVNEIASSLVNTDVNLGVVPAGSGNGFAHHHGISTDIQRAIHALASGIRKKIDVISVNDEICVNIAGVGYDALVAFKTKENPQRGLIPYVKESLINSTKFREFPYTIESYGKETSGKALMIIVANASTYGYNFTISPDSLDDDGLFEVIIIEKTSLLNYYLNAYRLLNNTILKSPFVQTFRTDEINITLNKANFIHLDGEGKKSPTAVHFKLLPLALNVIIPNKKG